MVSHTKVGRDEIFVTAMECCIYVNTLLSTALSVRWGDRERPFLHDRSYFCSVTLERPRPPLVLRSWGLGRHARCGRLRAQTVRPRSFGRSAAILRLEE